MHVLFLHERFVPRFGADRVLILLAQYLNKLGHKVSFFCIRYDQATLQPIATRVTRISPPRVDLAQLDKQLASVTIQNFEFLNALHSVDIVVNGGWPFVNSIPLFAALGIPVVFLDFGVVPLDGYSGKLLETLEQHIANRKACLPFCQSAIAISDFIMETQTKAQVGDSGRCFSILLGADHFESFSAEHEGSKVSTPLVSKVQTLVDGGCHLIMNLGRWEPRCYKNSDRAERVFAQIASNNLKVRLLVLAKQDEITPLPALQGIILPIGYPSDRELAYIISQVRLGVCMSLWEGFNLPLAEMQWQGCPALVFDIGAHPEVVFDDWLLCKGEDEMAAKAIDLLDQEGSDRFKAQLGAFRRRFQWRHSLEAMSRVLLDVLSSSEGKS